MRRDGSVDPRSSSAWRVDHRTLDLNRMDGVQISRRHIVSRCRGSHRQIRWSRMLRVKTLLGNPFLGRHPLGEALGHGKFSRGWGRDVLPPHHRRSLYIHPFVRIISIPTIHTVHPGNVALFVIDVNGKIA